MSEQSPTKPTASLRLDGELTIYRAAELKAELLEAQRGAARLEIDLAGVTEIDTSGLQILMLLKREAQASGRTLALSGHSPAVLEVLDLLDLVPFFGDAIVTDAQPAGALQ